MNLVETMGVLETIYRSEETTSDRINEIQNGCNVYSNTAAVSVFRNLKNINFTCFVPIVDQDLKDYAKYNPGLEKFLYEGATHCTGKGFTTLLDKCTKLTSIAFRSGELSDEIIETIAKYPRITHLDLSGSDGMTEGALILLAKSMPSITHIALSCVKEVTGAVIKALPATLTFANFSGCEALTDDDIVEFSSKTTQLEEIVLSYHSGISNLTLRSIQALFENCAFIRKANFNGCDKATCEVIEKLKTSYAAVEISA